MVGSSDVDRASEELAVHRSIEMVRRSLHVERNPLLETPQADLAVPTLDLVSTAKSHRDFGRNQTKFDAIAAPASTQARAIYLRRCHHLWHRKREQIHGYLSRSPQMSRPTYPAEAVRRRAEGTAHLRITVSNEGEVIRIEIKHSSGWPSLDQAAMDTVSKWRFQPQRSGLVSKSQSVVIPIQFELKR